MQDELLWRDFCRNVTPIKCNMIERDREIRKSCSALKVVKARKKTLGEQFYLEGKKKQQISLVSRVYAKLGYGDSPLCGGKIEGKK